MISKEKLADAIQQVLDELKALPPEELARLLEEHASGEFAQILIVEIVEGF